MIVRKFKQRVPRVEIDLTGPQGNIFYLFKAAKTLDTSTGIDSNKVIDRMKLCGGYYGAVNIFHFYYQNYVTLIVDEELETALS